MAAAAVYLEKDSLDCTICKQRLKGPVTLACGHSYCMECIDKHWNQEEEKKIYTCPQCRRRFEPRPVLQKSIVLAEIVEQVENGETPEKLQYPDKASVPAVGGRRVREEEVGESGMEIQECKTDGHTGFLQNLSSSSDVAEDQLLSKSQVHPRCRDEVPDIRPLDFLRNMVHPEPTTRAQFLRYSRDITLDPNTAHSWLLLSEGNRKVRYTGRDQYPPHHPDRFTHHAEVLSRETLTGACYWEVQWTGNITVAVAYKNVPRSRNESLFGCNDKSWALLCLSSGCSFVHNNIRVVVSTRPSSRVGVYLDHSAGLLSFYNISEAMTLLHRVQTTFTQPLHAGVCVESTCEFLNDP